jgi:hypothetical protein
VAGAVLHYQSGRAVGGVVVHRLGPTPANTPTDITGQFAFSNLGAGPWTIEPRKTGGDNGAITALDASLVLRDVAGTGPLGLLEALACDVNGDGGLDVADAVLIVSRRVGLIAQFPVAEACSSDWYFYPFPTPVPGQSITYPNPAAVPCRAGSIAYNPLSNQALGQNFIAVLFGDCSGSWRP